MTDRPLIQGYAQTGDEAAFRQIVSSYIDFVYSCARRQVRDPHMAEDVTQVVFMILARKASAITSDAVLPSWFFKTVRFVAADMLTAVRRRQVHERKAAQMRQASDIPDRDWEELEPYLDDALARLGRHERDAVLLRYFRGMSLRETGAALGISENTAAKRISRAIEKLRLYFTRRGITVASVTIAATIAAHGVQAAPAGLAASISSTAIGTATGVATTGQLGVLADKAIQAMVWAKVKAAAVVIAGTMMAGTMATLTWRWLATGSGAAAVPAATQPAPAVQVVAALGAEELRAGWGPEWANVPIAPGWPVALPGMVTGTPAVADLDGDGDLEVIVPSMQRKGSVRHPSPNLAALLSAFHSDGTPVKGWPVVLLDEQRRRVDRNERPTYAENWAASPSVADLDDDGREEVVITAPPTQTFVLNGDGTRRLFPQGLAGGEVWSSFPIVDLNGDGKLDLVCRSIVIGMDGRPVPGWKPREPMHGFAPCIGDANGDGAVEVYYSTFAPGGMLYGLTRSGGVITGWPQEISNQCLFSPVMGDVDGDGKMEIVAIDARSHLWAWTWHGRALASRVSSDGVPGVFKERVQTTASPTLADLDGDGAAEIIVFDERERAIKVWRGNGKGLFNSDGTLVHLPDARCWGGVTVGDLGGDGIMDLFVATYWVQLAKDGRATVINLLPRTQPTTTQCLITDIDRDGRTDILFALADGQVFTYLTGKEYKEAWMQWPAPNGNLQRTGVWRSPSR